MRYCNHLYPLNDIKQALREGLDVHTMTASKMFDFPLDQMTPDIRRRAKAINFGVIYGLSDFVIERNLLTAHERITWKALK